MLLDTRKHHVTTMLPKFFCLGLLTSKNQFVHAFSTYIVLVRLTVFRWFQGGVTAAHPSSSCLCCLFTMLTCFFKTSLSLSFWYSSALQTSWARVQGFSLIVTTHNSTALKVSGITEDIFTCSSFWYKKISLSLFSRLYQGTNSTILMDAKQFALTLLLFLLFGLCVFDNLCAT